ncbi:hypothetical protein SLE2022_220040 [Rubroshorea leprosula]
MSVFAQRMGTSATGPSLILGGAFPLEQTGLINQGIRDKITSAANSIWQWCGGWPFHRVGLRLFTEAFANLKSLLSSFPFDGFSLLPSDECMLYGTP